MDSDFIARFNGLTEDVARILIWHEMGEAHEDESDEEWLSLLQEVDDKTTELYLRGIKDVIADTSEHGTLKGIVSRTEEGLLYFFAALMDNIRKLIYPDFQHALRGFEEIGEWGILEQVRRSGYEEARKLRAEFIEIRRKSEDIQEVVRAARDRMNPRKRP